MKNATHYLANLTSLRGIAALLTVIFHVDLMLGMGGDMLLKFKDSFLFTRLYLMVDFFFVLSGFIMMHVYGKWFADSVLGSNFKRFTIARFARVYPLHFVTLLYCIGLKIIMLVNNAPANPMDTVSNDFSTIPSHLLLLHSMNVNDWFTWNNASWSISTEWWMYMLFPFLVKPFSKLGALGRIMVVFACFAGYLAIMFWIVPLVVTEPASIPLVRVDPALLSINVSYQFGFLRCLFGFVLGMMMYAGYQENWGKSWLSNGYSFLLLTLGLVLCMHFAVPDVFTVSFFPLMILSAAYGSPNLNTFLGTNVL